MNNLKPKENEFVNEYLNNGGIASKAAKDVYLITNDNYARVKGHREINKPDIRLALDNHAEKAESQIYKLSQTANGEMVRLQASKDILDRAGYGATIKTQQTNVNVEITPEMFEIAKRYENELDKIEDENNIRPNLNSELDKEGGN